MYNTCMSYQTVNISLPSDLIDQIDSLAQKEFTSRSDIIRASLIKRVNTAQKAAQKDLAKTLALLDQAAKDLQKTNITNTEIDDFVEHMRSKK